MRSSSRFAVAVHVMAVLACHRGGRVTSAYLATSVNTNPVIIRRLLLDLQRASLINTSRGAGAGSRLTRTPGRVTLADVYRAVENPEPFRSPPRQPNVACPVGSCIRGLLGNICASARQALERDLKKTTLADLVTAVERARDKGRPAV